MGYYSSMIFLLPTILFTFWAQAKVNGAYRRFSKVASRKGITGAQAADAILRANGLHIPIQAIGGQLTDNYNPVQKTLNLSQGVYGSTSIAAIGIAAHECGHAVQDAEGYGPLKFRNNFVPVANIGSRLAWPILIIGLMFNSEMGDTLFTVGVLLFCLTIVFHLVTLPVELNASKRALETIESLGLVSGSDEYNGAKKVLSAAAMTYVAALAMAVANLIRIFAMRNNRR